MKRQPVRKPGQHGPLYLYRFTYTDVSDPGFGQATWRCWAYDKEHAREKFFDTPDGDDWRVLKVARVVQ